MDLLEERRPALEPISSGIISLRENASPLHLPIHLAARQRYGLRLLSRSATVYLPDYSGLPNKSNLCLCQFTGQRIRSGHLKRITDKCGPREMNNLCRFAEHILINLSRTLSRYIYVVAR